MVNLRSIPRGWQPSKKFSVGEARIKSLFKNEKVHVDVDGREQNLVLLKTVQEFVKYWHPLGCIFHHLLSRLQHIK